MKRKILLLGIDLLVAAALLLMTWIVHYKIPQKGTQAVPLQKITQAQKNVNLSTETGSILQSTDVVMPKEDWHQKFADKFTDKVVATDTSYTSPNLSVKLTFSSYDTGKLDTSNDGKHE